MNRRGFLASLAALAIAPSLPEMVPVVEAWRLPTLVEGPLHITDLMGWLPIAQVVGDKFCPPDKIYIIGDEAQMRVRDDGFEFFGLDRGKPVIFAHPAHVDELRAAIDDACAKVARAQQHEMFAG